MKTTIIRKRVAINATPRQVWDVVSDFGSIDKASPAVAKSYLTSDQKSGVGTQRHCDFAAMGAQVEERITGWDEGKSIQIEIFEAKKVPMMKDMKASFVVSQQDDQTYLTGSMEYSMSGFATIMNSLVMKKMNDKTWIQILAGFKKHCETGDLIDTNSKLELSAVESI